MAVVGHLAAAVGHLEAAVGHMAGSWSEAAAVGHMATIGELAVISSC